MKKIFLITAGRVDSGYDGNHTPGGKKQIISLKDKIPSTIAHVYSGTGSRHKEIAELLALTIDSESNCFGSRDNPIPDGAVFTDYGEVAQKEYRDSFGKMSLANQLASIKEYSLVLSDWWIIDLLGSTNSDEAALYEILMGSGAIVSEITRI